MKITLLTIGKTEEKHIKEGLDKYVKRLKHYVKFQLTELADIKNSKNLTEAQQKTKEAELLFKYIQPADHVVLLDEKGQEFTSLHFSQFLNKKAVSGTAHLLFIVGGAYGFDSTVYNRANASISLSKMTFSHQMVRLFFTEQLYRAHTILKGEPYHHE